MVVLLLRCGGRLAGKLRNLPLFLYLNTFLTVTLLEKLSLFQIHLIFSKNTLFPFLGAFGLINWDGFSLTTLITLAALYFFGGVTTKDFVLAMILGIAIGTYSSIFFCSSLIEIWEDKK